MTNIRTVGVLNITPDSFSDGGTYQSHDAAVAHARELFAAGAAFVDVGAESTNPQSQPLTSDQEITRLKQIIPALLSEFDSTKFSLDTYHPETLAWALDQGMRPILNDVSGLHNPAMTKLVATHNLCVVISHLPTGANGVPTRAHTTTAVDDITPVAAELLATAKKLQEQGLPKQNIILDPGIGFGKTMRLNWELLGFPAIVTDYDVMLGYSRKRFLHTTQEGTEIPEAIARKHLGGAEYDAWLTAQHASVRTHITKLSTQKNQTVYLRLHRVSD